LDIAKLRIKAERSELLVRLSESVDSPSVKGKTVARSSEKAKLAKRTKAAGKKA
jgi:hypothetical protein